MSMFILQLFVGLKFWNSKQNPCLWIVTLMHRFYQQAHIKSCIHIFLRVLMWYDP